MIPKSSASLKRRPDTEPEFFSGVLEGLSFARQKVSWVFLYLYALSKYAFRKFQRPFDDRRIAAGDGLSAGQRGVE
jgi:hypothetical protein